MTATYAGYIYPMIRRAGILVLLAAGPAVAQDPTPYAGFETREIKALSTEEIEGLLAGEGLGYALAAELNRYPGPRHTLAFADSVGLSPEQRTRVEAVERRMRERAIALGREIVDAEGELDRLFASGSADATSVEEGTLEIARLEAGLRAAHLIAHLETRDVLTEGQVTTYVRLRGYSGHPDPSHRHVD